MRRALAMLLSAALTAGCASGGPRPQPLSAAKRQDAAAGARFARRACAGCHALEAAGDSPNPHSPPFRTLAARLPGPALEAQLAEIARRGHVEMPPIYMTPEEIRAVAAYIRAVQAAERGPGTPA